VFQASSAPRTFRVAVSRVNGENAELVFMLTSIAVEGWMKK
jgi:hypothetical protein